MHPRNLIGKHNPPSATTRSATANPILRFTRESCDQLSLRREHDDQIRGFGITAAADPLAIEEIRFLDRSDGADVEVLEFLAREIERELPVDRCARVWIGTRPGRSARPTSAEVATFARLFGAVPWCVLFLVAHGGATYARLRYKIGPGGDWKIPVVVVEPLAPTSADHDCYPETFEPVEIVREFEPDDVRFRPDEWPITM